jgi:DNA-binding response OmpR family regulator
MTSEAAKHSIVVIQGDEALLALIPIMLSAQEIELHIATSGKQGLDAIQAHHPELVILDLNLPDMNGWELFVQLQSENGAQPTRFIILASQASRVDRNFGLQVAQVQDYLLKPFLPSQLRRSVSQALSPATPLHYTYELAQISA